MSATYEGVKTETTTLESRELASTSMASSQTMYHVMPTGYQDESGVRSTMEWGASTGLQAVQLALTPMIIGS